MHYENRCPSASEIEEMLERIIDLFWIDGEGTAEFLKGAMCALDKIIQYKRRERMDRDFFKQELREAMMVENDYKERAILEKGEQTSFLS